MFQECPKKNIISLENQIGTSWGNISAEEIIKAGEEEKQLAQERGDIANGYPAITAIVDGGVVQKITYIELQC